MLIRSRDIRNKSQKLSKIPPHFVRFLPSQMLLEVALPNKNCMLIITPASITSPAKVA